MHVAEISINIFDLVKRLKKYYEVHLFLGSLSPNRLIPHYRLASLNGLDPRRVPYKR